MKLIFLIFSFVFSILAINVSCYSHHDISKNEQAVNKLLGQVAKDFKKRYKMQPIGTNIAMPRGSVKLLGLHFEIRHPLTKEEIRQILIKRGEEFLMIINSNEEIRPYIKRYPFEIEDINIAIFITDENRREIYDPGIGTAQISRGKLTYCTTPEENSLRYESIISESYEEALIAIQEN